MKLLTLIDKIGGFLKSGIDKFGKLLEKKEVLYFTYGHYNGQIKSSRRLPRDERMNLANFNEVLRQFSEKEKQDGLRSN